MLKILRWTAGFLCAAAAFAQITPDQRAHDFQNLASLFAKRYAPLEWKRQNGFDLLDMKPWLSRVRAAKDNAEFYEICFEYVASLDDAHTSFRLNSNFAASLGFSVDVYDDKVLIEQINRAGLPERDYPFQVGDEVVSVDGRTAAEWIALFTKFGKSGNPITTRRFAADLITFRPESSYPRAVELGESASVVIRRAAGEEQTYNIRWVKQGIPFRGPGPIAGVKSTAALSARKSTGSAAPDYMQPLAELQNWTLPSNFSVFSGETVDDDAEVRPRRYILGFGARNPFFQLPANFVQRLGRVAGDFQYSGTFESNGVRIGYFRIPNFAPPNSANAIREIETEVQFLNANTDVLVLDIMRNTGGGCYMVDAMRRLTNQDFFTFGEEIRPTWERIAGMHLALEQAQRTGAEPWIIDTYKLFVDRMTEVYRTGGARTTTLPICSAFQSGLAPSFYQVPAGITYSKPIVLLTDELSVSAADMFAAMMQDNQRATIVGIRTMGGGGSVSSWQSGYLSESFTSNTNTLVVRKDNRHTPGYPFSGYIENVGIHPDIKLDYMTRENLMTRGSAFVQEVTRIAVQKAGR